MIDLAEKLDHYHPYESVRVVPNALAPNFLSKDYVSTRITKQSKLVILDI